MFKKYKSQTIEKWNRKKMAKMYEHPLDFKPFGIQSLNF